MAEEAVSCEPLSSANSLLDGKNTGNFEIHPMFRRNAPPLVAQNQRLTETFPTKPSREFPSLNRDRNCWSRERGNVGTWERGGVTVLGLRPGIGCSHGDPRLSTTLKLLAGISTISASSNPAAAASSTTASRSRKPQSGSFARSRASNASLLGAVWRPNRR